MERVKVKEVAKLLGVSEQYVRIGLQRGWLPIGSCVKMSTVYTYHISPHLLEQYIGTKKAAQRQLDGNRHDEVAERTI